MICTFVDRKNADVYRFDFRKRWFPGRYEIFCVSHPDCPYPMESLAHLDGDRLSVMAGREPRTVEQAKALAVHWLRGFSVYSRTGVFPNGPARVNVAEQ